MRMFLVYVTIRGEEWSDVMHARDETHAERKARLRAPHASEVRVVFIGPRTE